MYSAYLQAYVQDLSEVVGVDPDSVTLLRETLACFIGVLGRAIDAETYPVEDILKVSVRLLLLDDGISRLPPSENTDRAHYLIGMGFEQTGELLSRLSLNSVADVATIMPQENDYWYRLTLALLHYLAGGHRVQALSVMRHLERVAERLASGVMGDEYRNSAQALRRLYSSDISGINNSVPDYWTQLIFQRRIPENTQERRIQRLALRIQQRRDDVLETLGQGDSANWLGRRISINPGAVEFWDGYLRNLKTRGITTFTNEQVGPGFDQWLRVENNLIIVLPTGSGKTIIGELSSALTLANGQQVVWILPTRALVRQTRKELRRAFEFLGVTVDELPTTEDYIPLFADNLSQRRYIAVTTPEKLDALLRVNPDAITNLGLVVFDEAQMLLKDSRGTTAESVLQRVRRWATNCKFALMTAFAEDQAALQRFIERLNGPESPYVVLSSSIRPTRRIYGVITDTSIAGKSKPLILLYPPGIQNEVGRTKDPFELILSRVNLSATSKKSKTHIAHYLLRATTAAGVRSVLFVQKRESTETHAKKLLKSRRVKSTQYANLPELDLARLRAELGRESIIEDTAIHRVAPHHAGLTLLEQHFVELWVQKNIVRTVIATPTLAQGINLPFDLSIVGFVKRRNQQTGQQEPLALTEIQNMLGRAGRAGQVSDGICLVAAQSRDKDPVRVLDRHRRYFFANETTTSELVGLRRLVTKAVNAKINRENWLLELDGLDFNEVQAIVPFILGATRNSLNMAESLYNRLNEFPSLQLLSDEELRLVVQAFEEVAIDIHGYCFDEPVLLSALERTGMPVEILEFYIRQLRSTPDVHKWDADRKLVWLDQVVQSALEQSSTRKWYARLMDNDKLRLDSIIACVKLWRSGATITEIETTWRMYGDVASTKLGGFLNHQLSVFAQFWGALAVCDEILNEHTGLHLIDDVFRQVQTFVREGVFNLRQLEWLRAIGGLDRVLGHKLADISIVPDEIDAIRRYIHQQMKTWHSNKKTIPPALQEPYRSALIGILNEVLENSKNK